MARLHLCNYLIVVLEALENYIEEDVANALNKKVMTNVVVSSPSSKPSKLTHKQIDLNNYANFTTAVLKIKPSLDKVSLSNMMVNQNFLERQHRDEESQIARILQRTLTD